MRILLVLCCIISVINLVHAADDIVVVRSTDSQLFSPGQLLDLKESVNLPPKAQITVVFPTGGVETITGPYNSPLTDPLGGTGETEPELVKKLANFITEQAHKPKDGNTRGTNDPNTILLPSQQPMWAVDVNTSERYYCIAPSSNVVLWRPEDESQTASLLHIKHKSTGKKVRAVWPARQTTLKWPESLPITYGETYTIEVQTRQRSPKFKILILYQVPTELPTDSHKIVWMVGRGCVPQASLLLASLR
jgi:hypothetical protein